MAGAQPIDLRVHFIEPSRGNISRHRFVPNAPIPIARRATLWGLRMSRSVAAIVCAVVAHTVHASPDVADVTVIDAQFSREHITYSAPGYADSTAGHFDRVKGLILSLRLHDGRIAVLNCRGQLGFIL
jgi:hypothetical protein